MCGPLKTRNMKRSHPSLNRGLCSNETPLRHDLKLGAGVPSIRTTEANARIKAAMNCIVANLIYAGWRNEEVFYSRDNSYYAATRSFAPPWFTRSSIVVAVAMLVDGGYAEESRTLPSPSATYRSRLRATTKLMDYATRCLSLASLHWDYSPPVVIRGRRGNHLPSQLLGQNDLIKAIELDVEEHNRFLASFEVRLSGGGVEELPSGVIAIDTLRLDPTRRRYVRIFNEDLNHGGRWYGGWWQSVPARNRPGLSIDGQPTIECDFAACQLRLMFGHLGLPDPLAGEIRHSRSDFDPYRIDGIERDHIKRAIVIMANAGSAAQARSAMALGLANVHGVKMARKETARIFRAVEEHLSELKPLWFTGIGLRMQRIDSDICAAVQRTMRERGMPVLSIHDSFVAQRRYESELRAAMQSAFKAACPAWRS